MKSDVLGGWIFVGIMLLLVYSGCTKRKREDNLPYCPDVRNNPQGRRIGLKSCEEMMLLEAHCDRDSYGIRLSARAWYSDHLHLFGDDACHYGGNIGIRVCKEEIEKFLLTSRVRAYSYRPQGVISGMVVFSQEEHLHIIKLHFRSTGAEINSDEEMRTFLRTALSICNCEVVVNYLWTNIPREIFLDVGFRELNHGMSWVPPGFYSERPIELLT